MVGDTDSQGVTHPLQRPEDSGRAQIRVTAQKSLVLKLSIGDLGKNVGKHEPLAQVCERERVRRTKPEFLITSHNKVRKSLKRSET